jgi:hypothetical protein
MRVEFRDVESPLGRQLRDDLRGTYMISQRLSGLFSICPVAQQMDTAVSVVSAVSAT